MNWLGKVIHFMEMLGMPTSMLKTFQEFREYKDGKKIRVIFIDIKNLNLENAIQDNMDISNVLSRWKVQENKIEIGKAEMYLKNTKTPPPMLFHCELQILSTFNELGGGHKFIGVSKLCCELCWLILRNTEYIARGAHHKVSANWAAPFPRNFEVVAQALKQTQDQYKDNIFRTAHTSWKNHAEQHDTMPASTNRLVSQADAHELVRDLRLINYPPDAEGLGPYKPDMSTKESGGFAIVRRATKRHRVADFMDLHPTELYALKEIPMRDREQYQQVGEEIAILRKVKHRNILELVDAYYVADPRVIFLATKPWAPLSLHTFLSNAKDGNFETWHNSSDSGPWLPIMQQLLEGLHYIHTGLSKAVIHKDLKPRNILLYTPPQPGLRPIHPVIADFGISKEWTPEASTQNFGTHEFKAPEQIDEEASTTKSDIWSLGCCFTYIFALLLSDGSHLPALWQLSLGAERRRSERGFAKNIDGIHSILDEIYQPFSDPASYLSHYLMRELREMLNAMLEHEKDKRPEAHSISLFLAGTIGWVRKLKPGKAIVSPNTYNVEALGTLVNLVPEPGASESGAIALLRTLVPRE